MANADDILHIGMCSSSNKTSPINSNLFELIYVQVRLNSNLTLSTYTNNKY